MVRSALMVPPRRRSPRPSRQPRAPRRVGSRTTLRVPDDLAETVGRYAEQHRTSTNDALIRLAYDGAKRYERKLTVEELAAERGAALDELMESEETPPGVERLSDEEVTRAILGFRLGLYDEETYGA
jgi:hypothetical protein